MRFTALGAVGSAAALLLVAACGSDPAAAPAGPAPGAHTSHSAGSAPPPAPLRAGERFVDIGLTEPYTPAAPHGGTDEYRCFLVDPKLTEPAYLTGSRFLPQNAGIVLSRIRLLELVWGYDFDVDTNVVDVFVGYLRRKLDATGVERLIETVRGVGFVLRVA